MNIETDRTLSKVEITGAEAHHYDAMMNVATLGTYPAFIKRAMHDVDLKPDDQVLILGSGTGRNACLMMRDLGPAGRILGLDIGDEMLSQAQRRCKQYPQVTFEKRRIEVPLPYQGEFDKVFISFVFHGLVQEDRLRVIGNVYQALRPGGQFIILDYAEFEPETSPRLIRWLFKKVECPLATDFVRRDWKETLSQYGFDAYEEHHYYRGYVQLLAAHKETE